MQYKTKQDRCACICKCICLLIGKHLQDLYKAKTEKVLAWIGKGLMMLQVCLRGYWKLMASGKSGLSVLRDAVPVNLSI